MIQLKPYVKPVVEVVDDACDSLLMASSVGDDLNEITNGIPGPPVFTDDSLNPVVSL